jgi:predicted RNA-binding protein with TRAM domain
MMKKTRKNVVMGGIFAVLAILGLVFTACETVEPEPYDPTIALPAETSVEATLTADAWATGNLTANDTELWYKFTATGDTLFIHFQGGTTNEVGMILYEEMLNEDGESLGRGTPIAPIGTVPQSWLNFNGQTRTVTTGKVYYLKITYGGNIGTFQIAFSFEIAKPGEEITPLTASIWASGYLVYNTNAEKNWYSLTPASSTLYVHLDENKPRQINLTLYDKAGKGKGGLSILSDATTLYGRWQEVTVGEVYYLEISKLASSPMSEGGNYSIAFNDSTTPPPLVTIPTTGVIDLTANAWTNGNTVDLKEQWYKFTATANTYYIHFGEDGTKTMVDLRLFDSTGVAIGKAGSIWVGLPLSRTVTTAGNCYIKVLGNSNGAYKIAATTNEIPPPSETIPTTGVTDLTADTWENGNIAAAGNEQWYKFTATADPQFIHYKLVALTTGGITVQLYNAAGAVIGRPITFTSTANSGNQSRPVTSGQTYYIKVKASTSTATGTYQIAFNTSSTAPTTP